RQFSKTAKKANRRSFDSVGGSVVAVADRAVYREGCCGLLVDRGIDADRGPIAADAGRAGGLVPVRSLRGITVLGLSSSIAWALGRAFNGAEGSYCVYGCANRGDKCHHTGSAEQQGARAARNRARQHSRHGAVARAPGTDPC